MFLRSPFLADAGLQGAKDRGVVEFARKNDLLFITQDQKPADLAELMGAGYFIISNVLVAKIADQKIREKCLESKSK